jgi:transposase
MSEDSRSQTGGKRPYYRPTTADQRKRLFAVYEQTHSVRQAVAAAHVGSGTYYYWRQRFEQDGYPSLEQPRSHRPHTLARQLAEAVRQEVLAAKREHPEWGRQRIADELRKAHGWQAVVSPSEVRRMLVEAGLWRPVASAPKGGRPAAAMPQSPTRR